MRGDSMPQKKPAIIRLRAELWDRFSVLIPVIQGRGRKPSNDKGCFEALLYLLRISAHWSELPREYPPKSTVHDALKRWSRFDVLEPLWAETLLEFDDLKGLEWEWLSADGVMTKAPLGGEATGKNPTDRGKSGTKRHTLTEGQGIPIALLVSGANIPDVSRLEPLLHWPNGSSPFRFLLTAPS